MKQTLRLNENYGKNLRDKISAENSSGLRGEVEILLKNKETGAIESQQRHNLIVYGAREWLLKKCFASNVVNDNTEKEFLRNSEILWFGVGNGGGEPGNPLQCGCTYGSDKDLYNPIRLRYEFDTGTESTNPYYASRIMSNGDVVNGYYKKITYVGLKEDQANPYKKNGVVYYPNLIAEVRLEISSDDCCGQSWLNNDVELEYADVNEAALFIADKNLSDPGRSGKMTYITQDFMPYDTKAKRTYRKDGDSIPEFKKTSTSKYEWDTTKPFPDNAIQYFDILDSNGQKLYAKPVLFGLWTDSTESADMNKCTGYLQISGKNLTYSFTNKQYGESKTVTKIVELTQDGLTLDDLTIKTHGTVLIDVEKTDRFDDETLATKPIDCVCRYRNSYTTDFKNMTKLENLFVDDKETYKYIFPVNYIFDENGNLVEDLNFNKLSIIRFVQSVDIYFDIKVDEVKFDANSTEVRMYCDDEYIDKINEGMKIYFPNLDEEHQDYPSEENPATIVEIFDARLNTDAASTTLRSYFTIDSLAITKSEVFEDGIMAKAYKVRVDSPYTMFNRCTFSTIRISKNRELLLVWRVYF